MSGMPNSEGQAAESRVLDRSGWPVVVDGGEAGESGGPVGVEVARAFTAEMDELLAAGEHFALVVDMGRWSRDAQQVMTGWLGEHFAGIGAVVAAMATVVAPATVDTSRRYIAEHPDQYPCPAGVAASRGEALAWVRAQLAT
jgi:hypothetical protein